MQYFSKYWRVPKVMWGLFATEFCFTVALLALFGIADPNTYRTKLWQEGANHGWNSDPADILLSYGNHRPRDVPLIWSQFITTYNVVISVLAMFFLLTKVVMFILDIFVPPLSIILHSTLIALFAYSTYAQSSSDTTDPDHKQTGPPWYLTKSCDVVSDNKLKGYCEQAKASFAVTIIMMVLFLVYLGWAVFSNFTATKPEEEEDDEFAPREKKNSPTASSDQDWEMQNIKPKYATTTSSSLGPKSPGLQPFTPRTTAFHKLGGGSDLPLRR